MLPSDDAAAAERLMGLFPDTRVTQFHDPRKRAGAAFAAGRVPDGPAWDIYMFFQPGARWGSRTPEAVAWVHQLRALEDSPHLRTGPALAASLHQAMLDLGFTPTGPAPDRDALDAVKRRIQAHLAREISDDSGRPGVKLCARCAARGDLGTCVLANWRRVVARKVESDEPGDNSLRIELTGDAATLAAEGESHDTAGAAFDLQINGLACPECMKQVVATALFVPQVSRVALDLDSGTARVWTRDASEEIRRELVSRLTDRGYPAQLAPSATTAPAPRR